MYGIILILAVTMFLIFMVMFVKTCKAVKEYYKKHNEEMSVLRTAVWVLCTEYAFGSLIFMFGWYQAAKALAVQMFDNPGVNVFISCIFLICTYEVFILYNGSKLALKKIESGEIDDQE